jgi:glycosyltransferase 2 family protein
MNRQGKTMLVFAAKLVVSVVLLTILFQRLDAQTVGKMLGSASVPMLVLGMCWTLCLTLLSTLKWQFLLREQAVTVPYLVLARIYLVGQFINLFMPSVAGGDAYRTAKLRHYTAGIKRALPSIIVERGTGVAALVIIGILGLSHFFYPGYFWTIVAVLVVTVIGGYLFVIGPVLRFVARINPARAYGGVDVLSQILGALRPSRRFFFVVVISFLFHLGVIVMCFIYSKATAIPVLFSHLLLAIPITYFVEMLPISINGIGVREGTLTLLFGMMGLLPEHGLLLGLTITMMRYVTFGIAGGAMFAWEMFGPGDKPAKSNAQAAKPAARLKTISLQVDQDHPDP